MLQSESSWSHPRARKERWGGVARSVLTEPSFLSPMLLVGVLGLWGGGDRAAPLAWPLHRSAQPSVPSHNFPLRPPHHFSWSDCLLSGLTFWGLCFPERAPLCWLFQLPLPISCFLYPSARCIVGLKASPVLCLRQLPCGLGGRGLPLGVGVTCESNGSPAKFAWAGAEPGGIGGHGFRLALLSHVSEVPAGGTSLPGTGVWGGEAGTPESCP